MIRLSVIVPAFNEARFLGRTLAQLQAALASQADRLTDVELIVCDNNSTDQTAEVARQGGATVVFEPHNQIGRARNRGAQDATGDWLLFVDADTHVPAETFGDMLDHIETDRYVAGGCAVRLDGGLWYGRLIGWLAVQLFRWMKMAGGSFVFCRADAFRAIGGFDLEIYAGEEVFLSRALKRWGRPRGLRFAFLTRHAVVTSARKLDRAGIAGFLRILLRAIFRPYSTIRSREHLGFFYDPKR